MSHDLRADHKHTRDVPDATTVHGHRHDKLTDEGLAGAISVVSDELTAAIHARRQSRKANHQRWAQSLGMIQAGSKCAEERCDGHVTLRQAGDVQGRD
jgi:hypothetical protein